MDLARAAGISTQQVRNDLDAGVLPSAERTAAGYRRFTERHRRALLTYRALARSYGWTTAREIMRAVHAGDRAEALGLVDAAHAALHEQRRALAATAEALAAVTAQAATPPNLKARADDPDPPRSPTGTAEAPGTGLRVGEAAALLGMRPSALRLWEAAGLLAPPREHGTGYRRYRPEDVRDARVVQLLRQARYHLAQIEPVLADLRRAGSTDALRAALDRRRNEITRRSAAMLAAAGELHAYLTGDAASPEG
ncbi:DNA-binding transcriptional regulator, MerR family [Amycolatopsis arida]|uniref:DNA-binding transcriptional regulator, MerR family n=1 Tax=Amycolatopsis arida TaxID=587909 RepID=A0A1I5Z2D2_9PSEU|nr:MerR family transcriptional regulator [Amycolatopsis arida]TDX90068.1 DNA-binding transcriptional MerR regulator [Amycolatopsis arida]SFQ50664.1 DNA-binding transcriptional regulator, MerR family [Amycolatopsis arida]